MVKFRIHILACLLLGVSALASTVVEDSRSRFVLDDAVVDASVYGCTDEEGAGIPGRTFVPENSEYDAESGMPFRIYRVAVPAGSKPRVSLSVQSTVPLGGDYCSGVQPKFSGVKASAPALKDGLWIMEVVVPLYEKSGSSLRLRKRYRLTVDFSMAGSGINPGKRAVSRVDNPEGASKFGVRTRNLRGALKKSGAADISGVHFLARLVVGDRNHATLSEDGLYAVEFKTIRNALVPFLRQSDLDGIPVEKLRLYGASPDTLEATVPGAQSILPAGLFEIPIEVRDHSRNGASPDGTFGEGDSIVFAGYGTSFWKKYDSTYYFSSSPYSYFQYFQLGWSETGKGLRLDERLPAIKTQGKDVPWMRFVRSEKDAFLRDAFHGKGLDWESTTGKEWFWYWHCRFDTMAVASSELTLPQVRNLPGLVAGKSAVVDVSYFPYRSAATSSVEQLNDQRGGSTFSMNPYAERMSGIRFDFLVNGTRLSRADAALLPGGNFRFTTDALKEGGNEFSMTMLPNDLQYDRFDGFSVAYRWEPSVDSAEWMLPGNATGVIRIPAKSDVEIMKFVDLRPVGLLSVESGYARDSIAPGEDVRYLAYRKGVYRTALSVEIAADVPDGVLKDISKINSKTEYLIISAPEFLDGAVSLGEFRSGGEAGMSFATTVVNVDDVYRQYTGGSLSPVAIRNYIAYAYSVCEDLKYVLLLGYGHYDYRGFTGKLGKNFIPPFEMEDAVTEDFFAALDSGEMVRFGSYDLDLSVGRMPVMSTVELSAYIEKAKEYEKVGVFDHSEWRNTLLLTADDAKNGVFDDHMDHTNKQEGVSRMINALTDEIGFRWSQKKVYLLDYDVDAAGQKRQASQDFINILNQGALLTTYFGHGSKTDWAGEGLLKPSYLSRVNNKGRYTILNSFSCAVGRFDEGGKRSLSEEFLIAPGAGSIASVGAARETYGVYNELLGKNFVLNLLANPGITIGDAFVKAKKVRWEKEDPLQYTSQRYNNEHYILFGEPVIQMLKTDFKVSLDQKIDTLKALDKMRLSGSVRGMSDGNISLSLREGSRNKRLYKGYDSENDTLDVLYEGSLIYSEQIPVAGGRFETEFVLPRKIAFGDTAVEFSAWAYSKNEAPIGRLRIGGIGVFGFSAYADSIHDAVPPTIQVQSCFRKGSEASYADGETVKMQSPACLQVVVEDSTGLDFREQADEGIMFELRGVEAPYHPFPFMEQNSRRAVLRKEFASASYPAGKYVFTVQAQDVLGNIAKKTVNLEITDDMKAGLADVFNVPNPVGKKGTTFYFKNLAVDRESTVDIFIYNQHGRLVKVLKDAVSGVTHWDGKDNHGRLLANGLYHYVVRSEVAATNSFKKKTWTKKQKLLISR